MKATDLFINPSHLIESSFFFLAGGKQYWGLNSGPCTCQTSPLELQPSALSAVHILPVESHIYTGASLDQDPIYASHGAGITGLSHHTQHFLVEMGSQELSFLLFWLVSNCDPPDFCLLSS
jgi:hypothetical protein